MRKLLLSASALAIAALAFGGAVAAQDATPEATATGPTIADIVVSSATGDMPEFATLLAAVQAADPAVLEALSDPSAQLTVFAPTDAAFAALAEALGEDAFNAVLADPAALTNILLFHVVDGKVPSADLISLLEDNGGSVSVPSLQGQNIDFVLRDDGVIEINGVGTITAVDIEASNGVIHVIDSVILPETRTLAEVVTDLASAETPEFTTLLAAVVAADPAVLAALSDPDAALTVFAPTDAAFAGAAQALGDEALNALLADPAALANVLLYHVIGMPVYSTDLLALFEEGAELPEGVTLNDDGSLSVTMANGDTATIAVTDMGVTINGANVIAVDVEAANGVIHVIDQVILPPM